MRQFEGQGDDKDEMDDFLKNQMIEPELLGGSQGMDDAGLKLLKMAINICKDSFFWRFKTINSRLKLIKKTHAVLIELLFGEMMEEE
jgi:hypothetical protein